MKQQIPFKEDNPKGLHKRYYIQRYVGKKFLGNDFFGEPEYRPIFEQVDKDSEYFVMRLDFGGKDLEHIKACRIGINAYADAIQHHLPELSKDLKERYPLI